MRHDNRLFSVYAFALVLGWVCACVLEPRLWAVFGTFHLEPVFLDAYAITAAGEAHVLGEPVFESNWRDPFGREHAYSDWWLRLWPAGLGVADTATVAAFLLIAGLGSVVAVAGPRDARGLAVFLVFWLSPACLVTLERGNNDLLIFACVAGVVAGLARGGPGGRVAALVLGTLAAGLKFYPAALGALAAVATRTWRGRLLAVAVAGCVVAGLAAWFGLVPGAWPASIPNPPVHWTNTYGARYLAALLGADEGLDTRLAAVVFALQLAAACWLVRAIPLPRVPRQAELAFAAGAILIVSTFVAGGSYEYRVAALCFCLPYLVAMTRVPGRTRWISAALLAGFVAFAWASGFPALWFGLTGRAATPKSLQFLLFARALVCWGSVLVLGTIAIIWALREVGLLPQRTDLPSGQPTAG